MTTGTRMWTSNPSLFNVHYINTKPYRFVHNRRGNDFSTGWSRPTFSSWGSGGAVRPQRGPGQADFDNNLLKINLKSGLWVDGRIGSADRSCDKSC